MNKVQKTYAIAKSHYEACEESLKEYERAWIVKNGVKRLDGSVPNSLWQLCLDEEESMFLDYSERLDNDEGFWKLMQDKRTAYQLLHDAEEALIDYGLSIAPAGIREILDRNRCQAKTREKLLDLTFRLDPRTVKTSRKH